MASREPGTPQADAVQAQREVEVTWWPLRVAVLMGTVLVLALAGCGEEDEDARREGLGVELGGVTYNFRISRQINPNIPPGDAYYKGPRLPPGEVLFGVFLEACNDDDDPRRSLPVERFQLEDSQGNEYEPLEPREGNPFAYRAEMLAEDCIPETDSVAARGPGAVLLFKLPLAALQNRPVELVLAPEDAVSEERLELDL